MRMKDAIMHLTWLRLRVETKIPTKLIRSPIKVFIEKSVGKRTELKHRLKTFRAEFVAGSVKFSTVNEAPLHMYL